MLNEFLYIQSNTKEDRQQLKEAGFTVCVCSNWSGASCLCAHLPMKPGDMIHGFGYDPYNHSKSADLSFLLFEIETQSSYVLKEVKSIKEFIKCCKDGQ